MLFHIRRKRAVFSVVALTGFSLICSSWFLFFTPKIIWLDETNTKQAACVAGDWLEESLSAVLNDTSPTPFDVAFLIIDRKSFTNRSVESFVSNICSILNGTSTQATFFIFTFISDGEPFEQHLHTNSSSLCGKVLWIPLNQVSHPSENPLDPNRCEIFLRFSGSWGYFNVSQFSYVLAVDTTISFSTKVKFERLFLDDLLVFAHQSLIKKWGRWSKGAVVYSSKLFGGRPRSLAGLCRNLVKKTSPSHSHEIFDDYFKAHQPKRALFLGLQECKDLHHIYDHFAYTDQIAIFIPSYEEEEYLKYLEVLKELDGASQRQRQANKIRDEIKNNFFAVIRKRIALNQEQVRNIATCKLPKAIVNCIMTSKQKQNQNETVQKFDELCEVPFYTCNGLGDRLRGTVTALYLAMATERVFHVDWVKPSDLADYFQVNELFYDVDVAIYNAILPKKNSSQYWILRPSDVPEPFAYGELVQRNFSEVIRNFTNVKMMTNRFAGLEGLLRNPSFQKILAKTVPSAFGKFPRITDYLPAISGAMQAILGKPQPKLQKLFDKVIQSTVGAEFWQRSTKIGVQIRTEIVESSLGNRVVPDQVKCFIDEVERIISLKIRNAFFYGQRHPVVVFVTADWDGAFSLFLNSSLSRRQQVKLVYTGAKFNLTVNHMEKARLRGSDKEVWLKAAKGFLDWYILTKMDFLVISRSGFGESASLLSLKPSRRFKHWLSKGNQCFFDDYYEELTTLRMASNVDIYDIL